MSSFWHDLNPDIKRLYEDLFPSTPIKTQTNPSDATLPTKDKLTLIETIAKTSIAALSSTKRDPATERKFVHLLAIIQCDLKTWPSAEESCRLLIAGRDILHPDLSALYNLSLVLLKQKKYSESEPIIRALIPLLVTRFGEGSQQVLGCTRNLGGCVGGQGRREEAEEIFEIAREAARKLEPKEDGEEHLKWIKEQEDEVFGV